MGRLCAAVAFAAAWSSTSAAAAPADDRSVVVLAPALTGEVAPMRGDAFADALRDGLRQADFRVVDAPAGTESCRTPQCASQAADDAGTAYSLLMTIGLDRRDYTIVLELHESGSEAPVARTEERCEVCGAAEALDVVKAGTAALGDRLDAMRREAPTLSFVSAPPGAIVRLDGNVVGETPFDRVVVPGQHEARAEREGYVPETQSFEAVAGVATTLRFELDPVPPSVRNKNLRALGWAALGVGAAAVVSGVTLIAIDGKPNTTMCDGANVDPRGNCKFVYATLPAGIGVGATGIALVVTGIVIAVKTRPGARRRQALASTRRGGRRPWRSLGSHRRLRAPAR